MHAYASLQHYNKILLQLASSTITGTMSPWPNHKDIYVKAFSTLRMGLPVYEPSDVQLGDIGFMDENDGFFHKLYNVAEPPVDIIDCPPAVNLVKGPLRYEHLDAIYLKLNATKGSSCRVNVPFTSMGDTVEMAYKFGVVHGCESILIPGKYIVKESLEELGVLREYMTKYHQWIEREFAIRHDFKLKQLILVVGTVKTNSWAIAVTSKSEIVENLAFNISRLAEAKVWGEWSKKLSVARCGPYMENNKENTAANQTIFIRRISLRSDIPLGKKAWVPTHAPRTFMKRLLATLDLDDS